MRISSKFGIGLAMLTGLVGCGGVAVRPAIPPSNQPFALVLGTAQDAGYPQAGCLEACCAAARQDPALRRHAVGLAIVDPVSRERWMLDCSPSFSDQLWELDQVAPFEASPGLSGIFLTHAHIGHYAGLLQLGHEVMGAQRVPVFAMPRMRSFLETQGPWDQLVSYQNILLHDLNDGAPVRLNERLRVTPFLVPHRDEYSETVGFRVDGPNASLLYLPDIDKWERWATPIEDVIASVDVAYLDGCFFGDGELPGRDMSVIQHPFILESLERFESLPEAERAKVRFLHLNHTNPVLRAGTPERFEVEDAGLHIAEQGEWVVL